MTRTNDRGNSERIGGLVGLGRRAGRLSIGSRETRDGLWRGTIHLVLLAGDGSPRDRQRLERVAGEVGVPAREVGTRAELGSWIGRGPVSVLGIQDPNLAAAVQAKVDAAALESEGGE
jgi:ribosomal protein L7Ae-like RNA K-turn-binding protein